MAMAPPQERSKPLHNFSLPCLKWGHQRLLRCVKVTDHGPSSSSIPKGLQSKPTNLDTIKGDKPNPVQVNLASPSDHRLNDQRIKGPALLEEERGNVASSRPWNLRTRRAACKAPLRIEEKRNVDFPRRNLEIDSPRRNGSLLVKKQSVETVKERVKFSVSLSKKEIEEDFMEMARMRPHRRPKKRPRYVQKYLDTIFPGLWLTEVTADFYKVPEVPES